MSPSNPFEKKPHNLGPDDAEFLKKHADVDSADLEELNLKKETTSKDQINLTPEKDVLTFATNEEREAYLNELVTFGSTKVIRKDYLCVKNLLEKIDLDKYNDMFFIENGRITQIFFLHGISKSELDTCIMPENLKILFLDQMDIDNADLIKLQLPNSLEELNLSDNRITSLVGVRLPDGLLQLELSYNPIDSLNFVSLPPRLKWLNLSYTKIKSLDGINFPPSLKDVYTSGTPLADYPRISRSLSIIKEKYPNIKFHT